MNSEFHERDYDRKGCGRYYTFDISNISSYHMHYVQRCTFRKMHGNWYPSPALAILSFLRRIAAARLWNVGFGSKATLKIWPTNCYYDVYYWNVNFSTDFSEYHSRNGIVVENFLKNITFQIFRWLLRAACNSARRLGRPNFLWMHRNPRSNCRSFSFISQL